MDESWTGDAPSRRFSPLSVLAAVAGIGALVLALVVWQAAQARPATPATSHPALVELSSGTRTSDVSEVTVEVDWPGVSAGLVFRVSMNTHSVGLDGYDLRKLAVLRVNGTREITPISWDAPLGGHHRSGTLVFPTTAADGTPLLGPAARSMDLVIRGVADVPERVFRWP
jgi:hypothetical protein